MKLVYCHSLDDENTVIYFGIQNAKIWRKGFKPYSRRHNAIAFLRSVMEEKTSLPDEPDEIVRREPDEDAKEFEDRVLMEIGDVLASFERVFPKEPGKALETPRTFYKSLNAFPPSDIWYDDEKKAKKDADGYDTIYIGPVEVYDPEEIKRIEAEIASYSAE